LGVVKKDTFAAVTDIINIEDPKATETTFTYKTETSDALLIRPVCTIRPAINSFIPLENSENTRDSSIVITFSENLSEKIDLDAIEITSGGVSVKENYLGPVLNENTITIAADLSNLITVQTGKTKTITVTIPDTFFYEKDGSQIPLASGAKWSFKVNSNTSQQAEITFSASESQGSVTPSSTNKYNIGDIIALSFEAKTGIRFLNWKILDGEGNEPSDSVLLIEDKKAATTKITVLNSVKGVSVTPVTEIIPGVSGSVIPAFAEAGVAAHSRIAVNFVTPMNSEDLKDFKNISITCNNTSITSKFMLPELSSDGKILTIKPIAGELEKLITDIVAEITVTLHKEIRSLQETEACLPEDYSWTYRINKNNTDVIPPELNSVSLKMNNINGKDLLTIACTSWTDDDYKQNHIKDTVFVTCTGSDADSGVKTVKVTETLLYSPEGTNVNKVATNNTNSYGVFLEKEPGIFSADFEYKLHSAEDGIIQLDFLLYDNANLASSAKTVYVIKDTAIPQSFTIANGVPKTTSKNVDLNFDLAKIVTTTFTTNYWATNINTGVTYQSEYSHNLFYGSSRDSMSEAELTSDKIISDTKHEIVYTVNPDFTKNTILKFCITDEAGNTCEAERFIPHSYGLIAVIDYNTGKTRKTEFLNDTGIVHSSGAKNNYYRTKNEDGSWTNWISGARIINKDTPPFQQAYCQYVKMPTGEKMYSNWEVFDSTDTDRGTPAKPSFEFGEIKKGEANSSQNFITIKLTSELEEDTAYYFQYSDSKDVYRLNFDNNREAVIPLSEQYTNRTVIATRGALFSISDQVTSESLDTSVYDTVRPKQTFPQESQNDSKYQLIRDMYSYDGSYIITTGYIDSESGLKEQIVDEKSYMPLDMHFINYDSSNWTLGSDTYNVFQKKLYTILENSSYNNIQVKGFSGYNKGTIQSKFYNNLFYAPYYTEEENINYKYTILKKDFSYTAIPVKDIEDNTDIICNFICYDKSGNSNFSNYISWYGTVKTLNNIPTLEKSSEKLLVSIPDENELKNNNYTYSVVIQKLKPVDETSKRNFEWSTCRAYETKTSVAGETKGTTTYLGKTVTLMEYTLPNDNENSQLTYDNGIWSRAFTTAAITSDLFDGEAFNNDFIKVNVAASKYTQYTQNNFFSSMESNWFVTVDPAYSYPVYLYTGDNVCNSKNWQEVNGKIQISHDRPCFVQTVCSAKDRGDDNYYEWERRGEKLNKQYFYTTSWKLSDYEPRLDDIPDGDYYRFIIHYADGSYQMTDTRRK